MTYQQHITVEYDGPAGGLQAGDMLDGYGFEFKVIGYSAPVAMIVESREVTVEVTPQPSCQDTEGVRVARYLQETIREHGDYCDESHQDGAR